MFEDSFIIIFLDILQAVCDLFNLVFHMCEVFTFDVFFFLLFLHYLPCRLYGHQDHVSLSKPSGLHSDVRPFTASESKTFV